MSDYGTMSGVPINSTTYPGTICRACGHWHPIDMDCKCGDAKVSDGIRRFYSEKMERELGWARRGPREP